MRSNLAIRSPMLLVVIPVVLFLSFILKPLWAQKLPPGKAIAGEIEGKEEVVPPEPIVYPDDWKGDIDRLVFMAKLDGFYTLSDQSGSDTLSGGGVNALLSLRYQLKDRAFLNLMYSGSYHKELDFYSDEVGPRERTERNIHTVTPMLRINFGEKSRYAVMTSFFHARAYNKDVEGGDWDDGLYNYRDTGGGLDFEMKDLGFNGSDGAFRLGVQYYERDYPNFVSLLDTAFGIGIEEDERDYNGILAKARYGWTKRLGFSWVTDYYFLYKMLDDKKVVDANGVLTSRERTDYVHSLDLRFWYNFLVEGRLRVGLDLNGRRNKSNQNYYDGIDTFPNMEDDVFLNDFYDYNAYLVRPNVSYAFVLFPLTCSLAYSFQKTDYTGRRAQDSDGTYKGDKQWETRKGLSLRLGYDLSGNWGVYSQWRYVDVSSNNDDESVYQYEHTVNYYYLGVSFTL